MKRRFFGAEWNGQMAKVLRASVMRRSEWFKERNQDEWKRIRT